MADEEVSVESVEKSPKGGKKLPIIIAALMLVEGAAVFALVKFLGSGPSKAEAQLVGGEAAGEEAPLEVLLVSEKFQNMQTGRVWE